MKHLLIAAMIVGLAPLAQAIPFTETITLEQTERSQDLTFSFDGLSASDGTDGFITIASAIGSDFDLSTASNEWFDMVFVWCALRGTY